MTKPRSLAAKIVLGVFSVLPALSVLPLLWFLFGLGTSEWLAESERSARWFAVAGTVVTIGFLTGVGLAAYYFFARVFTGRMRQPSRLLLFVMFAPAAAPVFWHRVIWREESAGERSV
jgi:hypothetical protein